MRQRFGAIPPTLNTLKAASRSFRMAMGVLHAGKVPPTREVPCSLCTTPVVVLEGFEGRSVLCAACHEQVSRVEAAGGPAAVCLDCQAPFTEADRGTLGICGRCVARRREEYEGRLARVRGLMASGPKDEPAWWEGRMDVAIEVVAGLALAAFLVVLMFAAVTGR